MASKIIHFFKCKRRGMLGGVALQIDISKAYDRVDWGYLRQMMIKLGFSERSVNWIILCVTSVNYSIMVNSEPLSPVMPARGLRQGNPLSHYLFILCVEGLSNLIKQAERRGDIHGAQICKPAPIISRLLFTDDCFLFFRASQRECDTMKLILNKYEAASGQAVNMAKSEIFFFSGIVLVDVRKALSQSLGVGSILGGGKYLGLSSIVGRNRKVVFNYIEDKVWRRINSWGSKSLSKARREVLVKSVLQAIPSYYMSVCLFPPSLGDDIEKL